MKIMITLVLLVLILNACSKKCKTIVTIRKVLKNNEISIHNRVVADSLNNIILKAISNKDFDPIAKHTKSWLKKEAASKILELEIVFENKSTEQTIFIENHKGNSLKIKPSNIPMDYQLLVKPLSNYHFLTVNTFPYRNDTLAIIQGWDMLKDSTWELNILQIARLTYLKMRPHKILSKAKKLRLEKKYFESQALLYLSTNSFSNNNIMQFGTQRDFITEFNIGAKLLEKNYLFPININYNSTRINILNIDLIDTEDGPLPLIIFYGDKSTNKNQNIEIGKFILDYLNTSRNEDFKSFIKIVFEPQVNLTNRTQNAFNNRFEILNDHFSSMSISSPKN